MWPLDPIPVPENSVAAATNAIDFLNAVQRGLDKLDIDAVEAARKEHDAMTALKLLQSARFSSY